MNDRHNEQTRILVADDEQVLCDLITKVLSREGYTVETAGDGDEALKKAMESEFDLLLLDIIMPGKDGIEVLRAIKEKQVTLAVILMTAHARIETAIEGIKLGADNYLLKPFASLDNLLIEVERALEKQRLVNENTRLLSELQSSNQELNSSCTKLKESYSEILYEQGKVEMIMNKLPEGLCVIDRERNITNFNSTAEEMTGHVAHEVIGKAWSEVFQGGDWDPDNIWDQVSKADDKRGSFELSINKKEGDYTILINLDLRILTSDRGDPKGAIITFSDIARV